MAAPVRHVDGVIEAFKENDVHATGTISYEGAAWTLLCVGLPSDGVMKLLGNAPQQVKHADGSFYYAKLVHWMFDDLPTDTDGSPVHVQPSVRRSVTSALTGLHTVSYPSPDKVHSSCIFTGTVDEKDKQVFIEALVDEKLERTRNFEEDTDSSLWTRANLEKLRLQELVDLSCKASESFCNPVQPVIVLEALGESACPNMMPFWENLYAVDKRDLLDSRGELLRFNLDDRVFERATAKNSRDDLQALRGRLVGEGSGRKSVQLMLSPLASVNLRDKDREKACIPDDARYFSFSHPVNNITAQELDEVLGDTTDPFADFLGTGAFVYFNYKYDIVGMNALLFELQRPPSDRHHNIYFDPAAQLNPLCVRNLDDGERWRPVTAKVISTAGFDKFAWVLPSEFLGDCVFPGYGGFAYKSTDDTREPTFYPVAPKRSWPSEVRLVKEALARWRTRELLEPVPVEFPLQIDEMDRPRPHSSEEESVLLSRSNKFISDRGPLTLAGVVSTSMKVCAMFRTLKRSPKSTVKPAKFAPDAEKAALGIDAVLGVEVLDTDLTIAAMREEMQQALQDSTSGATDADMANLVYVLDEPAKELRDVPGNAGHLEDQDTGHDGMTLQDFVNCEEATRAHLDIAEVAALRLYTTSTFRLINDPLRTERELVPLPVTTHLIYDALKKMRAIHLTTSHTQRFKKQELWRGLKDCDVDENFMICGGTELACMSTSTDLKVVAGYARSATPLLFRLVIENPMQMGAAVKWVSVFPGEDEVLFPPLTYLHPVCVQPIRGRARGKVITAIPCFPS